MNLDFQTILSNGITISSSGTSGSPKEYFQSPLKLRAANAVAIASQEITKDSRVYTCCKTSHAAGLLAQTLPALSIGAQVDIESFNPYSFVRKIHEYTHTHITPLHAMIIQQTRSFENLDLSGVWVTCGGEPVGWDIITAFVERGATFMTNWGMSEIGPTAINHVFRSMDEVNEMRSNSPNNATLIGTSSWCDVKVVDGELFVKGDICIFDDWYGTKDKVAMHNGALYYLGRTNKEVDLCKPTKG